MNMIPMILSKFIFITVVWLLFFGSSYSNKNFINTKYLLQPLSTLSPILDKVMPSIVSIKIEGDLNIQDSYIYQRFKPFFNKTSPFCNTRSPFYKSTVCQGLYGHNSHKERFQALGSGVILNAKKGYVVTNNHVVEHANKIRVFLNDGSQYEAKIIGRDVKSDIALIQLQNIKNLIAIQLANSDLLRVGDYTIAIGNPYGLGETVTSGIISALGRSNLNIGDYENFIQTDAAINRGNSGGALINLKGELIGINTAILAPDGGNIGIGFAIPGNIVKTLAEQISSLGCIQRGKLGVIGVNINAKLAKITRCNIHNGAFIQQVLPHSSAEMIGIKSGDIILYLNKKPIFGFSNLRAEMSSLPINTIIKLVVFRDKQLKVFFLKLDDTTLKKITSTMLLKNKTNLS